ncbi:MAG: CopG family transcriptional regulator [Stackebrandtia sp.]
MSAEEKTPTAGGIPLTDELIQKLADEAEAGYDVEKLLKKRGRKLMGSEPANVVAIRFDPELKQRVDAQADAEHTTVSDLTRKAVRRYLDAA